MNRGTARGTEISARKANACMPSLAVFYPRAGSLRFHELRHEQSTFIRFAMTVV